MLSHLTSSSSVNPVSSAFKLDPRSDHFLLALPLPFSLVQAALRPCLDGCGGFLTASLLLLSPSMQNVTSLLRAPLWPLIMWRMLPFSWLEQPAPPSHWLPLWPPSSYSFQVPPSGHTGSQPCPGASLKPSACTALPPGAAWLLPSC